MRDLTVLFGLLVCVTLAYPQAELRSQLTSIESLASQFSNSIVYPHYNLKTQQGINMDCLKAINVSRNLLGVFHSSIEQKTSGYNALYLTRANGGFITSNWSKIVKLSDRGSQGYLSFLDGYFAYIVLYELQNHQKGNTIAIRYYQSYEKLQLNNFLYEYQIQQKIDQNNVRNIGTPSVENITLVKQQTSFYFNQYKVYIKFHYSPDGQRDLPGFGYINIKPLRDFVDNKGQWIGGSKQNYNDWTGNADTKVQQAIARVGPYSKIGQRDVFHLFVDGQWNIYYLYQVNMNSTFNWKNWRIVLYSAKDNRAIQVPFSFGQNEDIANPRITFLSYDISINASTFWLSFFLPSQGTYPDPDVKPGEMTAQVTIMP